jgi:hypothetical protein
MPPTDFLAVAARLAAIIDGLLLAIATRYGGAWLGRPAAALFAARLERLRDGITGLAEQAQSLERGRLHATETHPNRLPVTSRETRRRKIAARAADRATRPRRSRATQPEAQVPRRPAPPRPPPPGRNHRCGASGPAQARA